MIDFDAIADSGGTWTSTSIDDLGAYKEWRDRQKCKGCGRTADETRIAGDCAAGNGWDNCWVTERECWACFKKRCDA